MNHFKDCLTFLIKSTNCNYDEAYESCMDALYALRKDLIEDKVMYGNLASFFNRRAKLVFLNKKRKLKQNIISLESNQEWIDSSLYEEFDYNTESESVQTEAMVKEAITSLNVKCQLIIKQFYYQNMKIEEIAQGLNKSNVATRKQISRCRDTLRSYLSKILNIETIKYNRE